MFISLKYTVIFKTLSIDVLHSSNIPLILSNTSFVYALISLLIVSYGPYPDTKTNGLAITAGAIGKFFIEYFSLK